MRKNWLLLILGTLVILGGCEKNDNENGKTDKTVDDGGGKAMRVNLGFSVTRVTDTAFESGDVAGVFMDGVYSNNKFSYSDRWIPEVEMYWPDDETPRDFYAYAPLVSGASDAGAINFQVKTDQGIIENYKASDFVGGSLLKITPTEEMLNIATRHLFSNMLIKVVPGTGFTDESFETATIRVQVKNIKATALVNLRTGTITATGDSVAITPYYTGGYWKVIIVPQTIDDDTQLIFVTVNDITYTLKSGFTFIPGEQSTFTVTVNKTNTGINIALSGWEVNEFDYGGDAE